MDTLLLLIFLMLCLGLAGWLFFLWAVKSGQYDDVEGPKYRMMDDDEDDMERPKEAGKTNQAPVALSGEDDKKSSSPTKCT